MPPVQSLFVSSLKQDVGNSSEPSLTQRSVHGFLWLFSQTVVTRLVNFAGQLILAWLLNPRAFGLIGLTYSIQAFITVVQQNGMYQLLVAQQSEYERMANPAFWYSLTSGFAAAVLMVVVAPLAAHFFGYPELTGLILVMAAAAPFDKLRAIPLAKLGMDLRFGTSALVNVASVTASMVLTVTLASLGFGVYSFVLPFLVVTPVTTLVYYLLTGPPLRLNPQFDRWRSLLRLSGLLLLTAVLNQIILRGDYLLLGALFSVEQMGIYFMAYSLSVQTVMLFSLNLRNILFPMLSKLQHSPVRQREAFIRAACMMALAAIPASTALAVAAGPLVHLLFPDKWLPVIPVLQVLALGMALRTLMPLAEAHMRARSRFGLQLFVTSFQAVLLFSLALVGARYGLWYFAYAVSAAFTISPIVAVVFTLGFTRNAAIALLRILAVPVSTSMLAAAITAPIVIVIPEANVSWCLLSLAATTVVFFIITIGMTRMLTPAVWLELKVIAHQVVSKHYPKNVVATT